MLNSRQTNFYSANCLVLLLSFLIACSDVTDIEITVPESVKPNNETALTIVRTGTGSGEWNINNKDGFNFSFSSYPAGRFEVEVLEGKENDYCQSSETNEVSDGKMRNEVKRDMLIKAKDNEITLAIACHKKIYRFLSADSVVNVQMIIEDAADEVRDTVVFRIVR
jgi:hypothetical protein